MFSRVAVANVFCVAATLALSAWVLRFVYGTAEPEILRIFRTLMCGCLITIPSILLGYPFLAAMGHPLFTNWTNIVTSILHITGLFVLYLCGALTPFSVAALVVAAETTLFSLRVWGVRRFRLFRESTPS